MLVWQVLYLLSHPPPPPSLFFSVKKKKKLSPHLPNPLLEGESSDHTLVYQAETAVSDVEMTEGLEAILGER